MHITFSILKGLLIELIAISTTINVVKEPPVLLLNIINTVTLLINTIL